MAGVLVHWPLLCAKVFLQSLSRFSSPGPLLTSYRSASWTGRNVILQVHHRPHPAQSFLASIRIQSVLEAGQAGVKVTLPIPVHPPANRVHTGNQR